MAAMNWGCQVQKFIYLGSVLKDDGKMWKPKSEVGLENAFQNISKPLRKRKEKKQGKNVLVYDDLY